MERTASFGYWLRQRRKALDLTQAALAQHLRHRRKLCALITQGRLGCRSRAAAGAGDRRGAAGE